MQIMPKSPKYQLKSLEQELTIGERIAKIRKQQGLTQKVLAKKIGVKQYLISDYERGRIRLYDEMVARFALALNVSADKILGISSKTGETEEIPLRLSKRIQKIQLLPASKQKRLLASIDDTLKANLLP
ncbi:hypothetical protein S1OALGB6SA_1928 [Olavius algarvensis spirochete endosymbiont]|uniref:helix-turn-helix domain-containing protein n=1 Tax=Olavius algarvensis spirochete endosymbiont TaxID=260710 RepID=UPI000F2D1276|nr:helix-turn-helix transcriptional regulator [Olavius algarvensis spirochete endosymbiont]VDB00838.1 hypothetical protein S1OALGB6SA_1928 [Olavius algarvensis spirochete endosymbiont]